jgi:hypothetical protein
MIAVTGAMVLAYCSSRGRAWPGSADFTNTKRAGPLLAWSGPLQQFVKLPQVSSLTHRELVVGAVRNS